MKVLYLFILEQCFVHSRDPPEVLWEPRGEVEREQGRFGVGSETVGPPDRRPCVASIPSAPTRRQAGDISKS